VKVQAYLQLQNHEYVYSGVHQVHNPCVHTKFSILISSVFCERFTLSFKFPFHPKAQPYSRHPSMNLNALIILHNKHIDDPP